MASPSRRAALVRVRRRVAPARALALAAAPALAAGSPGGTSRGSSSSSAAVFAAAFAARSRRPSPPPPALRLPRRRSAAAAAGLGQPRRGGVGVLGDVLPLPPAAPLALGRGPPPKASPLLRLSADPPEDEAGADTDEAEAESGLDRLLSRLTSAFPLFVLSAAVLGSLRPSSLTWVNSGQLIPLMLSSVMMGTGMTLTKDDFASALGDQPVAVPAGVLCQFGIMPLSAAFVGRLAFLRTTTAIDPVVAGAGPALFLGLALVGCSPGGTASNLVSLIAGADVALSVLLTAASTVLASAVTPLLVKALVGSTVQVSGTALCAATARVVLLPVALGMALNARAPGFSRACSRFTPFASVVLVALICGGVIAQNAASATAAAGSVAASHLLPRVLSSVLALHALGFAAGYLIPRRLLGFSERTSRTVSIETGMQNSALAVVLARSVGADPLASLPGALSATCHSCLGSLLAAYWRFVDGRKGGGGDSAGEEGR